MQNQSTSKVTFQTLKEPNEIPNLRVSGIRELYRKSQKKKRIDDITEFSALSDNGEVMNEIFTGKLIQRIKQLAAEKFAFSI